MITLLSPAKTMNYKDVPTWVAPSKVHFLSEAKDLVSVLKPLSPKKLSKTLGVSEKIGQLNFDRFQSWKAQEHSEAQPSVWAYSGDVYNGLDIKSFSRQDNEYAQSQLKIISGLYGIVRPFDLIVPYRLEMRTRLKGKWGKDLYDFWGSKLSDLILESKPEVILNCASDEYARAVVPHLKKSVRVITPQFYKHTSDGPQRKALFSKYTRGVMARWALTNRIEDPEDMKKFNLEGYKFSEKLSTPDAPAFIAPSSFTLLGRFTKT